MKLKKFFSLLIGLYLLFANSLTLTHHHEDHKTHPDCQVCVLQLNQQSEDPNDLTFNFEIKNFEEKHISKPQTYYIKKEIPLSILPRSPPLF
ncbi:hypothetical protein [Sulfurihydrogenibium sp.]|uniref:hypothetical protein n=1 Tax=Sulfurihydrogenibium sp. TaxID=2053621 RepID=UPI00262C0E83|nr:hypothetical protein [Sulfurihydrogenibium sp.]